MLQTFMEGSPDTGFVYTFDGPIRGRVLAAARAAAEKFFMAYVLCDGGNGPARFSFFFGGQGRLKEGATARARRRIPPVIRGPSPRVVVERVERVALVVLPTPRPQVSEC